MRYTKAFFFVFTLWLLLGVLSKVVFMIVHGAVIGISSFSESLQVIGCGLRLDMAIAAYLSLIPVVLLMVAIWFRGRFLVLAWRAYILMISFLAVSLYATNTVLYAFWGFPLDSTPLLYLKTSPADALASLHVWQLVVSAIGLLCVSAAVFFVFEYVINPRFLFKKVLQENYKSRVGECFVLLLLMATLILPIRGGLGTGTNHTGSVYFSSNIKVNHAAVNPIFSFFESVLHKVNIGSQFRFMTDEEANRLFDKLVYTSLREGDEADSRRLRFTGSPNVVIIMLESFSRYIMDVGGHVRGVTPHLDALSREGLYFDRFYANTVRTDRAIVSILSGLPSQPSMSIMDMPKKSTQLPSIARTLGKNGYSTHFYYGGDTNYSNMLSYVMGTGYQNVVSDKSFPSSQVTSKWGVHDGIVFNRILKDIEDMDTNAPFLVTI